MTFLIDCFFLGDLPLNDMNEKIEETDVALRLGAEWVILRVGYRGDPNAFTTRKLALCFFISTSCAAYVLPIT